MADTGKVSPLAPATFPELPVIDGVTFSAVAAGVKYTGRTDVMLAQCAPGTTIAGTFTRSATRSAPVLDCQAKLGGASDAGAAILVNSGNSNAFTGRNGLAATNSIVNATAAATGIPAERVFTASTGVIGEPLPFEKITSKLDQLHQTLSPGGISDAAKAIMTTDTYPKGASANCEINGKTVSIAGIAKGSGMIAPDMATMLVYIFTDARIDQPALQAMTSRCCNTTFNCITVDSDTSTSDSLLVAATGASGADASTEPAFEAALNDVMLDLAHQVVRDGEGATKFVDALPYAENKEDWRKTLHHLRDKAGTAGRWGFLYWATDPLDIPDYEDFANDFADVFGIFPQTTTAQAHLHLDRLRDLLPMSEARGCRVNRFSVLTEKSLKKIYEYFTPEEMLNVEIVSQMKDASVAKANTGDFRSLAAQREHVMEREKQKLKKTAKQIERTLEEDEDVSLVEPGTIACVSGFLLNMMSRTVKLISPCRASETWPLGYIVFDEMTFADADDLNDKLTLLIDRHMTTEITADMRMQFHPGLDLHETEDGFILASKLHAIALERPAYRDYVKMLGKLIGSGDRTASQIALAGLYMHGVPEDNTLATLNHLFDNGALVDAHGRVAGQKGVIDQ